MTYGQSEAVLRPSPTQGFLDEARFAGLSDGQLLARFRSHRDELAELAFAALVRRHGPMVLRVCRQVLGDPHTAEDAFQAVFLVLARRADSIGRPELLGNWLYGVALRTAREARVRVDRRRMYESPGSRGIGREPIAETGRPDAALARREELEALHEEVSRLPEKYRVPVVLCELEGLTYQEAAIRLHCPVGTIGVRLRRARERLRVRLTRRGLAPSAGLLGALVGAGAASAWVPAALFDSTIRAATRSAAHEAATASLVSAQVAALTEAVLRTLALGRLKRAAGLTLALGISATVGWVCVHRLERASLANPSGASSVKHPVGPSLAVRRPRGPATAPAEVVRPTPSLLAKTNRPVAAESGKGPRPVVVEAGGTRRPTSDERARGELLFAKEWVPDDPAGHGGDGLGPVYNESSCMACHGLGAPGGAGPESKNVVLLSATPLGKVPARGLDRVHPGFANTRSLVLHRFGTDPRYGTWRSDFYETYRDEAQNEPSNRDEDPVEARIRALRDQTFPGRRLRERTPRLRPTKDYTLTLSERNPPALFGAGRIDAIPSGVLVVAARRQPEPVRGRVSRTREGRIGRFGWKGQVSSLHEFVRAACASELGLDLPGHAQAKSPLAPRARAKGLDLTGPECDALVAYVRALPAPVVVDPAGTQGTPDTREGRRLFAKADCVACHTPSLGEVRGIYSDLLLHDMGQSLSDSGSYYGNEDPDSPGGPNPREWRTPPLWGYRDSGPYLHDGRAHTLEEAVALHEGQGKASAQQFFALSSRERSRVESFLKSLVAPSAAAAPGLILASELEARIEQEERDSPEGLIRRRREEAEARDQERWQEAQRRRRAEAAASRARTRFLAARDLDAMGKTAGALEYYREIAREAPHTEEGRRAAARIVELGTRPSAP